LIDSSTLSELLDGLTQSPCECRLVPLKQCGISTGWPLAVQLGSAGSLLCSVMVMVSPDLTSIAGAT